MSEVKKLLTVVIVALVAVVVTACDTPHKSPIHETPDASASETPAPLPLTLTVDKVDGVKADQAGAVGQQMLTALTPVLTTYIDQAFRGDAAPAYDRFTPSAAALAQQQAVVTTRAGFGQVKEVTPTRLNASAEVLAPEGQPAGATVRLDLAFDVDGREATVSGRLLLTPEADGWKIFGFDLTQNSPDPIPAGAAQ